MVDLIFENRKVDKNHNRIGDTFKMSNIKCGSKKIVYTYTICQTVEKVYIGYPYLAMEVCFMLPFENFYYEKGRAQKVKIITSQGDHYLSQPLQSLKLPFAPLKETNLYPSTSTERRLSLSEGFRDLK